MQYVPDTPHILFYVFGMLGVGILACAVTILFIIQKSSEYKYLTEKKEREHKHKEQLQYQQIAEQERMLTQISGEIHDNVGQVLSLVRFQLHSVKKLINDDKAQTLIQSSSTLVDKAINDLRNISHSQNAAHLERTGLAEAIHREVNNISAAGKITCNFSLHGAAPSNGGERDLTVYRIFQEAVQNAIKHAQCSSIMISLTYEADQLTLTIADNGCGFSISSSTNQMGIPQMHYRAQTLDGTLHVNSTEHSGTTITLKIPIA